MVYTYRTTTDKLGDAYQHVEESGDEVIHPQWMGGRDWVLVCRKGETRSMGIGS